MHRLGLIALLLLTLTACGGTLPPTSGQPAPTSPAGTGEGGTSGPSSLDEIDAVLSQQEKRDYASALLAAAPSLADRADRHGGDLDKAGKYLARDGVRLCQYIAENAEDPDAVARHIVARFEAAPADADAIREVTEQRVCSKL